MKVTGTFLLLLALGAAAHGQGRDWRVHSRGLLHQTVYNTGELGRAYNAGGTIQQGIPSLEWPPRSRMIIDRTVYPGQHNSFGSGIWIAGTRPDGRQYMFCGAVSDGSGNPVTVTGIYSNPISVERTENTPLRADGSLNPAFNPDEAEETIISRWGTPLGITVTRTSRAWSYPGYDSFIIYEYELANVTPDTLRDVFVTFAAAFGPSMFGYQRNHGQWNEGAFRGQPPAGLGDQFARFDLRRWMSYNHDREGLPDTTYFALWSAPGNRGGLNGPQAAGLLILHYDYEHLARRGQTDQVWIAPSDSNGIWDENGRAKQPFLLRYENGNLPPDAKTIPWMNPALQRKTSTFNGSADSLRFLNQYDITQWPYWKGRTKGSVTLSWWQPVFRGFGFYPYLLPPGQSLRFTVAEVVGYGPGVAGDRVYKDLGGNVRGGVDQGVYFNPVPSWYDTLQYPYLGTRPYIGSRYLQTNPLPWYVTPGVVSIRDVADRAIELYTGSALRKYDTLQYDPATAPPLGRYNTVTVPVPAPQFRIQNTRAAVNRIIWTPAVEGFSAAQAGGRLRAGFRHYDVLRAPHPLGPWSVIDSVRPRDPRYFRDSVYVVLDSLSSIGEFVYYAIRSVDSLGGRSGWTNVTEHETQAPAAPPPLGRVWVIPNPVVVTSGLSGSDPGGEVTDKIQFVGLTERCTIRIYSYSGQLVNTIEHERNTFGNPWYQITRNNQLLASGVYFFVVEDAGGATARGKFIVIH